MTLEEAYRKDFMRLVNIARRDLINGDYAFDCVHDVFARALQNIRHSGRDQVAIFHLVRDVNRRAQQINKDLLFTNNKEFSYDVQDDRGSIQTSDTKVTFDSENLFE